MDIPFESVALLQTIFPQDPDLGLLALRVALGIAFLYHGFSKIKNPAKFAEGIGVSALTGWVVAVFEFFGGAMIAVGFFTQLGALMTGLVMLGAIYFHTMKWGDSYAKWEAPFVLLGGSVALLFLGPGTVSVDALL